MRHKAVILLGEQPFGTESRAARLLEFFGIPYDKRSAMEFPLPGSSEAEHCYTLIATTHTFESVVARLQAYDRLKERIHSVFLFSNGDPIGLARVVSQLSGSNLSVRRGAKASLEWTIADDPDALLGAMRGLQVQPAANALNNADFFEVDNKCVTSLIGTREKAAFLKLNWRGVPVFVSSVPLLDIDGDLTTQNFDVRDHLFDAVPFVCYIRWAFGGYAWHAPESNACLVVDDPLLKARYGFVRYRELLALMKRVRFATTIAFIPWNWRRSDPDVVQLFKENLQNYSVCIHGCDHTAAEFGSSNREVLGSRASAAVERMSRHETLTGLQHDRVMVFPQGTFSKEAIGELKRAGFDAIVNTEVHSQPPSREKLKISDVWDVAVMSYGDFPIYTRRYPSQGIENLAFDLLLGKPAIVVSHHDFCRDGCSRIVPFIDRLNALPVPLVWRCLGDVVKRSYRQRKLATDSTEIEMYCNQAVIENKAKDAQTYVVRRREHQPDSIEHIRAGSRETTWHQRGDYIEFIVTLPPGESAVLALRFKSGEPVMPQRRSAISSVRTTIRRYLSEARDNYLAPAKARIGAS